MKKLSKTLLTLALAGGVVFPLASCDANAKPANINDKIVSFEDSNKTYFRDTFETLYDNYIEGGSASGVILSNMIKIIAREKLVKSETNTKAMFDTEADLDAEILRLCKEKLFDKVNTGGYDVYDVFQEEKLVKELRASLYDIKGSTFSSSVIITPEMDSENDYDKIFKADYSDYFEKSYHPEIYKKLLTAQYMAENETAALGRAQARKVNYIKIEKSSERPNAVTKLINDWLQDFVKNGKTTSQDGRFDLDSLSKIWKGVQVVGETSDKEIEYQNNYFNLTSNLDNDIKKIVKTKEVAGEIVFDYDANGHFQMLDDDKIDASIESKYTNDNAYTLDWGYVLAERQLSKKKLTGNDFYTKSEGIGDLPSSITDRIFSSSMKNYITEVNYTVSGNTESVYFLTPQTYETTEGSMTKYYHYDLGTNAYYIVVVDPSTYTLSEIKSKCELNDDDERSIKKYSEDAIKIAEQLGESSSNQREALVYYMNEYDVDKNIHDENFYDYLSDNYSEIFD